MTEHTEINGAELVARTLKALDIKVVFGLTGFPVTAILECIIDHGIKFIGFRNEQAASYAATAYGYLTGRPGACIVVGGPGVIHAFAGVLNSSANCFPLLLLAGSCDTTSIGKGQFQELDAVSLLSPHVKLAVRPQKATDIPSAIRNAYRVSWTSTPGTGFVDLPADFLFLPLNANAAKMPWLIESPPIPYPDERKIAKIAKLLMSASAPLVVVGKGCAYARAERVVRELIDSTRIPILPTPMGKGVVPESHPCIVSAARATALRQADVVLVLGARLNWILHFGEPPKWNPTARVIQCDLDPEAVGQNAGDAELGIVADVNVFVKKLLPHLASWQYAANTPFRKQLDKERTMNEDHNAKAAQIKTVPLKFEHAYDVIRSTLDSLSRPEDGGIVYVAEGARTMDTSRQWFFQEHPRLRLDAGTQGTMGVGFGYAIAAWESYNGVHREASSGKPGRKKVVGLIGDSATGFSGFEIETMARNGMDCLIFVMNNGGVYHSSADTKEEWQSQHEASKSGNSADGLRSWSLSYETRYDMFADAVGGKGYLVRTSEELRKAAEEGFKAKVPVIVNVLMESGRGYPAVFGFQVKEETASESKAKSSSKL